MNSPKVPDAVLEAFAKGRRCDPSRIGASARDGLLLALAAYNELLLAEEAQEAAYVESIDPLTISEVRRIRQEGGNIEAGLRVVNKRVVQAAIDSAMKQGSY